MGVEFSGESRTCVWLGMSEYEPGRAREHTPVSPLCVHTCAARALVNIHRGTLWFTPSLLPLLKSFSRAGLKGQHSCDKRPLFPKGPSFTEPVS